MQADVGILGLTVAAGLTFCIATLVLDAPIARRLTSY